LSNPESAPRTGRPTGPLPATGRLLALDLGRKRIGVAVCDTDRTVATPYRTVARSGHRPDEHAEIAELLTETGAVMLVVGLPLSLDGTMGPAAKNMLSEVKALRKVLPVPVVTHDERLSTVTAEDHLRASGVTGPRQRDVVDQVAAAVILQAWIDANQRS
jgi:putative Holliday junction resolvase